MRALVVYESYFGCTKTIAEVIGDGLRSSLKARVVPIEAARHQHLGDYDLLVVGAPTHARGHEPAEDTPERRRAGAPDSFVDPHVPHRYRRARVARRDRHVGGAPSRGIRHPAPWAHRDDRPGVQGHRLGTYAGTDSWP